MFAATSRRGRSRFAIRPSFDELERRALLSASPLPDHDDTVTTANLLTLLGTGDPAIQSLSVAGSISDGRDVDFYRFSLAHAAQVRLLVDQAALGELFGLYTNGDPFADLDGYTGVRRVDLLQFGSGSNVLTENLGPGDYFLAVSGAGNRYFNPYLEGSGYAGGTGDYAFTLSTTQLSDGTGLPEILGTDFGNIERVNGQLKDSPYQVRLRVSANLDLNLMSVLDLTLTQVGDPSHENLAGSLYFNTGTSEILVWLTRPLTAGSYELRLGAVTTDNQQVFASDFAEVFEVADSAPHETPDSAAALDFTQGWVQVSGRLAAAPASGGGYFDSNQVFAYQFSISGPDRYVFAAEAFAGRVDSSLNVALSLYRREGDTYRLVGVNDDTQNGALAQSPIGTLQPLFTDAALFAGLTAGEYYLVVSASGNTPDPLSPDQTLASSDSFRTLFSGYGWSAGFFVLTASLERSTAAPPTVTAAAPQFSNGVPTEIVVQFSSRVNLRALDFRATQIGLPLTAVELRDANGATYTVRLSNYDDATNTATFLVYDHLPQGDYEFVLRGVDPNGGITDDAGNPLVDGLGHNDVIIAFSVHSDGTLPQPASEPDDASQPFELGTLAPYRFNQPVSVGSTWVQGASHYYTFVTLRDGTYTLSLSGQTPMAPGTYLHVHDATTGQDVYLLPLGATLDPNSQVDASGNLLVQLELSAHHRYVVRVDRMADGESYQLQLDKIFWPDNPPPLTVGAAPLITLRLTGSTPSGPSNPNVPQGPSAPPTIVSPIVLPIAGPVAPTGISTPNTPTVLVQLPNGAFIAMNAGPIGTVQGAPDVAPLARLYLSPDSAGAPDASGIVLAASTSAYETSTQILPPASSTPAATPHGEIPAPFNLLGDLLYSLPNLLDWWMQTGREFLEEETFEESSDDASVRLQEEAEVEPTQASMTSGMLAVGLAVGVKPARRKGPRRRMRKRRPLRVDPC